MVIGMFKNMKKQLDCFVTYNDEVVNPHIVRPSGLLPASCLAVRNDGDLNRHQSFLQGIYPMPGSRNDVDAYRHCEARSNPESM